MFFPHPLFFASKHGWVGYLSPKIPKNPFERDFWTVPLDPGLEEIARLIGSFYAKIRFGAHQGSQNLTVLL